MTDKLTPEYVRSLERRIAEQRAVIEKLIAKQQPGNKWSRKKIAKLERIIGQQEVGVRELQDQIAGLLDRLGSVTEGEGAGLLTRGPSQGGAGSIPAASVGNEDCA